MRITQKRDFVEGGDVFRGIGAAVGKCGGGASIFQRHGPRRIERRAERVLEELAIAAPRITVG